MTSPYSLYSTEMIRVPSTEKGPTTGVVPGDIQIQILKYMGRKDARLAENALARSYIGDLVLDARAEPTPRTFEIQLDPVTSLPVANQRASGRCWIFAFTGLMRRAMIKKYDMDPSFQFSQKYVQLFDRLEKCNALLETMFYMQAKEKKGPESLEMVSLRDSFLSDGGTWAFFTRIVLKYGIVPQDAYPENVQSASTGDLRNLLGRFLLGKNKELVQLFDSHWGQAPRQRFLDWKEQILRECLSVFLKFFGVPPAQILWQYKNTKGKLLRPLASRMTPLEFYHTVVKEAVNLEQFVVLIHDPRRAYGTVMSVELSHNVVDDTEATGPYGGPNLRHPGRLSNAYLNVDLQDLKDPIVKSLRRNVAVPFAADVSILMRGSSSRMDLDAQYKSVLDFEPVTERKQMYENMLSGPEHAMLFVGASPSHTTPRGTYAYQVENSWGQQNCTYPYLTMSDGWMDKYVSEIIVHRNFVPVPLLKKYDTAIRDRGSRIQYYPFWDIFGQLAAS